MFGDAPHPTELPLSRLLLGTDHLRKPRCCGAICPVFAHGPARRIVADWRADLPDLCPAFWPSPNVGAGGRETVPAGDNLRRVFELAATSELGLPEHAIAI